MFTKRRITLKEKINLLLKNYQEELKKKEKKNHCFVFFRCLLFLCFLLLIIAGIKIPAIESYFMLLLGFILFLFICLCYFHEKEKQSVEKIRTILTILHEYKQRMNNEWDHFKDTGLDFYNQKSYLLDLDIIGDHSLYQFLSIACSDGGRRKLFERLSNPYYEHLEKEQKAVEELTKKLEFSLQFQEGIRKIKGDLIKNISLLKSFYKDYWFIVMVHSCFSLMTLFFVFLSLFYDFNSGYWTMSALLQLAFSYLVDILNKDQFHIINQTSSSFAHMLPLYQLFDHYSFESEKMRDISKHMKKGKTIIIKLNKIYDLNGFRQHFIGYIISNAFFPLNSYLLYSLTQLKNHSFDDLKRSNEDIEELESLISLSILGVCVENVCLPKRTQQIKMTMTDIQHPLLKDYIKNDFSCENDINMITGSNMSGKTSFMRTIGINFILMNAGGYVNASSFVCLYMQIFTSMRVKDDIEKGISTFYGELLRIKEVIDYKEQKKPFLVFIDEIFKGTNYNDRLYGAKEVIKQLATSYSLLFISTHDFELCDIDHEKIKNYYFEEYYEDNQIKFDYKIKKGKCQTTNALYLMKKLNIIKEEVENNEKDSIRNTCSC